MGAGVESGPQRLRTVDNLPRTVYLGAMKLSDAIRKGTKIRPNQCFGTYFDQRRSCVVGAAYEGAFGNDGVGMPLSEYLETRFPELRVRIDWDWSLHAAILNLNDEARWSREEIADWIDVVLP